MTDPPSNGNLLSDLHRRLGDRYEILRELGRGGMGAVLLARDRALDRPVALKVLPPEYASQPDLHDRFLREVRMAAGFSHPNIVPVFSIEDRDGLLAFAMGYVEGESLAERVRRALKPCAPNQHENHKNIRVAGGSPITRGKLQLVRRQVGHGFRQHGCGSGNRCRSLRLW